MLLSPSAASAVRCGDMRSATRRHAVELRSGGFWRHSCRHEAPGSAVGFGIERILLPQFTAGSIAAFFSLRMEKFEFVHFVAAASLEKPPEQVCDAPTCLSHPLQVK